MANIHKIFSSHVFSTKSAQSIPTNIDQEFSRLAESGRIVRAYGGVLPCTRRIARHLLRCEHLRQLPGERFQPYRVEPNYTHQIWLWYILKKDPDKLHLLFRGQFNFTIPGKNPDWIAEEIADFLAYLLINSEEHVQEVFRNSYSDRFWSLAVEKKFLSLRK